MGPHDLLQPLGARRPGRVPVPPAPRSTRATSPVSSSARSADAPLARARASVPGRLEHPRPPARARPSSLSPRAPLRASEHSSSKTACRFGRRVSPVDRRGWQRHWSSSARWARNSTYLTFELADPGVHAVERGEMVPGRLQCRRGSRARRQATTSLRARGPPSMCRTWRARPRADPRPAPVTRRASLSRPSASRLRRRSISMAHSRLRAASMASAAVSRSESLGALGRPSDVASSATRAVTRAHAAAMSVTSAGAVTKSRRRAVTTSAASTNEAAASVAQRMRTAGAVGHNDGHDTEDGDDEGDEGDRDRRSSVRAIEQAS